MTASIATEAIAASGQFVHLSTIRGIVVDLRYATDDNFFGRNLYASLDCAWLHREAAGGLEAAVTALAAYRPGYTLQVLDALRPQRIQEQLWEALQGTELQLYVADPGYGSMHSFGMALDVTLIDSSGNALDMGTAFDDLSVLSQPSLEEQHIASGALTAQQLENRQLLRAVMNAAGFGGILTEWWHFDFGNKALVRQTYCRVL